MLVFQVYKENAAGLVPVHIKSADDARKLIVASSSARTGINFKDNSSDFLLQTLSNSFGKHINIKCVVICTQEETQKADVVKEFLVFRPLTASEHGSYEQKFWKTANNPAAMARYIKIAKETYDLGQSSILSVPNGSSLQQALKDGGYQIAGDKSLKMYGNGSIGSIEISKSGKAYLLTSGANGEYVIFEKTGKSPSQAEINTLVSNMISWDSYVSVLLESKIAALFGPISSINTDERTKIFNLQATADHIDERRTKIFKLQATADLFLVEFQPARQESLSEMRSIVAHGSSFFYGADTAVNLTLSANKLTEKYNTIIERISSYSDEQLKQEYDSAFGTGAYEKLALSMGVSLQPTQPARNSSIEPLSKDAQDKILAKQGYDELREAVANDIEIVEKMGGKKERKGVQDGKSGDGFT
ncbi:MAG: hypothetical protein WCY41_02570 [Candidatus Micrarchaeia archaeon]